MTRPSSASNTDPRQREIAALRERVRQLEAELELQRGAGGGDGPAMPPCDFDHESARDFLLALPHGFEEIDLSGRIVWCNPARARLLGQSLDDVIGAHAWDRLAEPEAAERLRELIARLGREQPEPEPLFLSTRHAGGRIVHLRADWNYKRDASGELTGFLVLLRDITEDHHTRQALQKSLAQFQDFMTHFPGAAFMKDGEGRYVLVNPITAEILGGTTESVLGRTDRELLPSETAELLRANDLHVLRTHQPLRTIERMQLEDGEHTMLVVKFCVVDDQNRPSLAGMALDVTQRMREEQELRESRNQLRAAGDKLRLLSSAIEQSGEGVAVVRPDGTLEFANEAFARMHRRRLDELIGFDLAEIFSEGQQEDLARAHAQLRERGEFRGELWHCTPDGETFPCHENHSLVRDRHGKIIARIIVARDVSEAVAAEKRLQDAQALLEQRVDQRTSELADAVDKLEQEIRERRRAERELERVWDSTLELLALMDQDGRLRRVNRTFERTLHIVQHEVRGRHFLDLVADEDRERAHRACEAIGESRPAPRFTVRYRVRVPGRAQPELRWLEWAVTPVEDTELVYAAARDVTELRNFEERVARQQAELAHASRLTSMGEMASGIAHELNQPLAAISLRSEACKLALLRKCPELPDLASDLDYVRAQAERAGEIIRRLRGFIARREPESKLCEPAQLVRDVLHFVENDCEEQSVQLEFDLPEDLPLIDCDEIQVQQVVLNLVRNAIEALCSDENAGHHPRRVDIVARCAVDGDEGAPRPVPGRSAQVEIEVADNGPGLSPEIGRHLFEPFFSTKSNGLGIGLSLSKSIVESHGGSLLAYPRTPRGLRFVLSLPVHDGPARATKTRFSSRSHRTEARP